MPKVLSTNAALAGARPYVLPDAPAARWRLDIGENLCEHHPAVLAAPPADPRFYPAAHAGLVAQIAEYTGAAPDEIVLTAGSDSGLEIIMRAIGCATITVPVPTFPQIFLFLSGCAVTRAPVDGPAALLALDLAGADACYIVTPNLPLGYVVPAATVETLLAKNPAVWFVVDEAYFEFGGETAVPLCARFKNLVVTRTFSKAFALAGMRIGYFVAAPAVCDMIRPLVNAKSVTVQAARLASLALAHLPHYLANVAELAAARDAAAARLAAITGEGLPIYGYRAAQGMFLLLLSKTPQAVCDVFAAHGIAVRNKHDDFADSVRVSVGPQRVMDDVLAVCEFINLKRVLCGSQSSQSAPRVAFDLDLTLRGGSTPRAPLYPGAAAVVRRLAPMIVTNNNCLPADVRGYFAAAGLVAGLAAGLEIVTSVTAARDRVVALRLKPYVLAAPDVAAYFAREFTCYSLAACDSVLLAWIDIRHRDVVDICGALAQGKPLLYTDVSARCRTSCSTEFGAVSPCEQGGDPYLPDMGLIIEMIARADPAYAPLMVCVGKPAMDVACDVLVGDSAADEQQAAKSNARFVWVGHENRYNFEKKCFEVADMAYLARVLGVDHTFMCACTASNAKARTDVGGAPP